MNPGGTLANQRYRVLRKLAQGGMGAVYLADDTRLPGRKVAVKENLDASPEAQAQFQREAVLLARLEHPNLPRVTDFFIDRGGLQYLVMDYVPGDDLFEVTRQQGALPESDILACLRQIMAALHYMHTWRDPETNQPHAVIHRDIKPANIKRTPAGRYVLVDFGLAKLGDAGMTGASAKAYTPGYAPLEQYHGGTDRRSDVYSLGATLYALVTGTVPPSATSMANGAPLPPVRTYNQSVSNRFISVIERAMRLRADERYQSIDAMHQALFGTALAPKPAPVKRRPPMIWALGGAVTVLIGVVLFWLLLAAAPAAAPPAAPATDQPVTPPTAQASAAGGAQQASAAEPEAAAPTTGVATLALPAPPTVTVAASAAAAAPTDAPTSGAGAARATSTPLGRPGSATPAPDGTRATSTPIPTPTRRPSPTPRAAASPVPDAAAVAETAALVVVTPAEATGPRSVQLLFPPDGHSSDGPLVFSWAADAPLADNQEFEVVFWNPISESIDQSRSWARSTTESALRIDPSGQAPGSYQWGIYLVMPQPYERVRYLGGGRIFSVAGSASVSGPLPSTGDSASEGGEKP